MEQNNLFQLRKDNYMVIIDGKIAVSICSLGENNAYSYALVVRPDTVLVRGQDCYYYDTHGHAVLFDEMEEGFSYARNESLVLLPYTMLEALYEEVEGTGWVEAENSPFTEVYSDMEANIA
ncbi:hypothetical protein I6E91_14195 [Enterocloster clostridioformis]|uniref:hypothetical protein n=1 Tax=Enterocloster clostridioformis TaxID=1531 RepID=UPI001F31343D|nr:hypothetical protein [Enterocloster clostridioformis]MCF2703234.1 hypothetical protein [Enterocloster clostridioformis]